MASATTPGQPARGPKPVRPTWAPPALFRHRGHAGPIRRLADADHPQPESHTRASMLARNCVARHDSPARAALGAGGVCTGLLAARLPRRGLSRPLSTGAVPDWALARSALTLLPLVLSVKLLAVVALSCHRGWWRYATFADLVNLVQATTIGSLALAVWSLLAGRRPRRCRSRFWLLDWAGVLLVVCGSRAATRHVHEAGRSWFPRKDLPRHRVLVVGAGDAGEALVRRIHVASRLGMRPVGFLDEDRPDPWTNPGGPAGPGRPGRRRPAIAQCSGIPGLDRAGPQRLAALPLHRRSAPWSASARRPASRSRWCPGSMPCSAAD